MGNAVTPSLMLPIAALSLMERVPGIVEKLIIKSEMSKRLGLINSSGF